MEELILRALGAGLLVALITGPMGCFVIWQRMAYFGDTLAHSALLGIALSLLLAVDTGLTVLVGAICIALLLAWMESNSRIPLDTVLGMVAHVALAGGVILLGLTQQGQIDWLAYLFGDLLAVNWRQVLQTALLGALVLAVVIACWRKFVALAVDRDLAQAEGLAVKRYQTLLLVLMAITVTTAMQIVGVLLVTALLIIPAAAARHLANTPGQMAVFASIIGCLGVLAGVAASYYADIAAGPAIVVASFTIYLLASLRRT
ncbi:MAG: metal ABC transporter permease [Pseudomonadales bacterium]